jgi:hypothetical protein
VFQGVAQPKATTEGRKSATWGRLRIQGIAQTKRRSRRGRKQASGHPNIRKIRESLMLSPIFKYFINVAIIEPQMTIHVICRNLKIFSLLKIFWIKSQCLNLTFLFFQKHVLYLPVSFINQNVDIIYLSIIKVYIVNPNIKAISSYQSIQKFQVQVSAL